jgi:hypothetical protein
MIPVLPDGLPAQLSDNGSDSWCSAHWRRIPWAQDGICGYCESEREPAWSERAFAQERRAERLLAALQNLFLTVKTAVHAEGCSCIWCEHERAAEYLIATNGWLEG